MACVSTVAGRALPCRDSLGGIRRLWVAPYTIDMWGPVVSGEIVKVLTATTVKNYEFQKNTGSLTQTINSSIENGTIFYQQVVSVVLNKLVQADIADIVALTKGRVAIVVQDVNDNYFVVGHTKGCDMTAGTVVTGVAMGDANGFTLEFTGDEQTPAPFLDRTAAAAASPALTFTTIS